jgi:hypothetical protein
MQIGAAILRANPNIADDQLAFAISKSMPLMQLQSQQEWKVIETELRAREVTTSEKREAAYEKSLTQEKGSPATIAVRKYLEANPDATPEELQDFINRGVKAGAEAKAAGKTLTPAQTALRKFMEENPDATAKQIQDFTASPAFLRQDKAITARKELETQREGATAARQTERLQAAEQWHNKVFAQRELQFNTRTKLAEDKLKAGQIDPADVQTVANAIANYRQAPYTGVAARSKAAVDIMNRVYQINPSYDQADWQAHAKATRDFATGRQGDTARFLHVADNHLQQLQGLADKLGNADAQSFNFIKNALKTQLGYPEPTNMDTARQIIAAEVIKAVSASGGGGVMERLAAAAHIDKNSSPAQIMGAIKTYRGLLAGQLGGLRQQYNKIPGSPRDFDDRFSFKGPVPFDKSTADPGVIGPSFIDRFQGGPEGGPGDDSGWKVEPVTPRARGGGASATPF